MNRRDTFKVLGGLLASALLPALKPLESKAVPALSPAPIDVKETDFILGIDRLGMSFDCQSLPSLTIEHDLEKEMKKYFVRLDRYLALQGIPTKVIHD